MRGRERKGKDHGQADGDGGTDLSGAFTWDSFAAEPVTPVTQPAANGAATQSGTRSAAAAAVHSTQPTGVLVEEKGFSYYLDIEQAPELKEWANTKLKADIAKWYPIWVECLASDGFTSAQQFSITLRPGNGVAATGGTARHGQLHLVRPATAQPGMERGVGRHPPRTGARCAAVSRPRQSGLAGGGGATDDMRWFHYEPLDAAPSCPIPRPPATPTAIV